MVAVAVTQYSVEGELVAAVRALHLGLGRPYPYAVARATTRRNQANPLPLTVLLMLSAVFVETVVTVLLETEVGGLWMVIAAASMVQGVAVARLAFHLELVP